MNIKQKIEQIDLEINLNLLNFYINSTQTKLEVANKTIDDLKSEKRQSDGIRDKIKEVTKTKKTLENEISTSDKEIKLLSAKNYIFYSTKDKKIWEYQPSKILPAEFNYENIGNKFIWQNQKKSFDLTIKELKSKKNTYIEANSLTELQNIKAQILKYELLTQQTECNLKTIEYLDDHQTFIYENNFSELYYLNSSAYKITEEYCASLLTINTHLKLYSIASLSSQISTPNLERIELKTQYDAISSLISIEKFDILSLNESLTAKEYILGMLEASEESDIEYFNLETVILENSNFSQS